MSKIVRPVKQSGQAMTEYMVVIAFGLVLLFGPGLDLIDIVQGELTTVMRDGYRGYSYTISMSTLPDYATGAEMRTALEAEGLDQATIDQLSVDPLEDAMLEQLEQYTDARDQITDAINQIGDFSIDDVWDEAEDAALSFFSL